MFTADSKTTLSLDSAVARVVARNPDLRMWSLKAQARTAKVGGAKAWMPLEMSAGGIDLPYSMGSSHTEAESNQAFMISLRQMIPGWGKLKSRSRYLASLEAQEVAGGAWMKSRLIADTKTQYFALGIAIKKIAVLSEAEVVMNYMLKVSDTRFKVRQGDLASVQLARARLLEVGTMRSMEVSQQAQANSALNLLMTDTSGIEILVDTTFKINGNTDLNLSADSKVERADIKQMTAAIKAMELNLEVMRKQNRPDFGLQFDHMEMFGMGRRYSVMGMMTLPFLPWSAGMAHADIASMTREIESMRFERETLLLMATRMAKESWIMLQSEMDQYRQFQNAILPAYRNALDASMASYQDGTGDLFRVLDTWDKWVMARMEALNHQQKFLTLEAEYDRESGRR